MESFELYSSQVNCLPEEKYLSYFLGSLLLEVKHHLQNFVPRTKILAM